MARKPLIPRTESVRQYRQFILEHGRTPRQTAKDPHERRLGVFAKDFRQVDPAKLSREDADARAEMILLHNRYTTRRHGRRRIPDVPGSAYAVEVSQFYDAYGRLPKPGEPADREVFLAWTRLRRYAASPNAEALFGPLADIPGLMDTPGLAIERCLGEVREWQARHGRLPSASGEQRAERSLSNRWREVRRRYEELSPSGKADVDQLSQAYRKQHYQSSGLAAARRIAEFYAANSRLPRHTNPDEKSDYARLRNLRNLKLRGKISAEAVEAVSAVPDVFKVVRQNPKLQLQKLEAWCEKHGHLPRYDIRAIGKDSDEAREEAALGQWMHRHVDRSRHDPLETAASQATRDSILAIEARYPLHADYRRGLKAQKVLDFIAVHGRLPELPLEPDLFRHCFTIRQRWPKGGAPMKVINDMIAATHALPSHLHSQWDNRLRALQDFITQYGVLPRTGCRKGIPQDEGRLGRWLETAHEIGDPARVARLDAVLGALTTAEAA